jgi:cardiolipin synthase (CMP-forming)
MMWFVRWFRQRLVPWTYGRMFRTGIPLDRPVEVTDRVFTVANGITLVRILGLPVFVYLAVVAHAWFLAFVVFGTLAFLDSIDGYVARRFNQVTRLGRALDPLTDRLTLLVLSVTLVVVGVIPLWMMVLVLGRDLVLLTAVLVFARLGRPLPVSRVPVTRIGKLATMVLLVSLPFLILGRSELPGTGVIQAVALVLSAIGVALYYVALGQYLKAGITSAGAAGSDAARSLGRGGHPAGGPDRRNGPEAAGVQESDVDVERKP